jgi:glycosyltransferase involved in cell wall biosynthesis
MPTRDRAQVLERTLGAMARVRGPLDRVELVAVDDGSRDGTPGVLAGVLPGLPFPARSLRAAGRGPAAARNLGIDAARGDLVAFLGDDTMPEPGWLEAHLAAHARRPGHAVLGEVRWHPELGRDPFLDFLAPRGPQFDYGDLRDPGDLGFARFFTSNLSLPRAALAEERFDERFPAAAFEDVELGWRLERRGLRIGYEPGAVVLHLHRYDPAGFARRMEGAGRSARTMARIRPELEEHARPRWPAVQRAAGALLGPLPEAAFPGGLRRLRWRAVLGAAFCRGWAAGGDRG